MALSPESTTANRADVELRIPADSAFVSMLRTAAAGVGARLDFTIDDIEDLKIAVSEAAAMVLEAAAPGSDLQCGFRLRPENGTGLVVTVSVRFESAPVTDDTSFGWQVLTTLTDSAIVDTDDGVLSVTLTMRSTATDLDG